jgi:hypothetical protein
MSDDKLDQLLRENARAAPAPAPNHEAVFFARLDHKTSTKTRQIAAFVLTGIFAAAAAWFFMIYQAPVETPATEVVALEESVESYNALLDDDDDVYSLYAMTP